MANRLIIAGFAIERFIGEQSNRPVIRVFDDAGNLLSSIKTWPDLYQPTALAGDRYGRIYAALTNPQTGTSTFRKYHRDGHSLPTTIHHQGARIGTVLLDAAGHVFLDGAPVNDQGQVPVRSGVRSGYCTTRKFDSSGNQLWAIDNGTGGTDTGITGAKMALDPFGDVLIALWNTGGITKGIRKFSGATGALLWEFTYPWSAYPWAFAHVTVDNVGTVYALGRDEAGGDNAHLYRISSAGVMQAMSDKLPTIANRVMMLQADAAGLIHISDQYYLTVTAALASSAPVDLPDYNNIVGPTTMDADGNLYTGYLSPTGIVNYGTTYYQLMRVNPVTGAMVWGFENFDPLPKTIDGWWGSCTCIAIVENPYFPALRIPLALGIPTTVGDRYSLIPGLPLPLWLGVPATLREYVGNLPLQTVYRLQLTGSPAPLDLPFSSFICRRGADYLTISVVCPSLTLDMLLAIEARSAGDLIVSSGPRFLDGTEQLEVMLQAPFKSLRWDQGVRSASATLEARLDGVIVSNKTRTLRGISYRSITDGYRRVRCAVDPYLAPGDTADLGAGETMLVGDLYYQIDTESATMEVAESS